MSSASLYYTPSTTTTTTTIKPRSASTKRRVRFTFGYSSRTPSIGSLPPSPTTDRSTQDESSPSSTASSPSSKSLTSTSLPIMHMPTPIDITTSANTYNSRPTADDLTAMTIPTRTSSITSTTSTSSTLTSTLSKPVSRCSSINSEFSFNGSLDHRTMRSTSSGHKSNSSISSSTTMLAPIATTPAAPTAPERSASASPPSGRRPSVIERSAFLASAPVRSRAQIYPRLKNMCPAPSTLGTATTTFFTNNSLPSLTTRCFSNFQTSSSSCCLMNPCAVSLEKRRWSNDSTRGLYGSIESTFSSSSGTLSFLSNTDGRTSTSSSSDDSTFNGEKENTTDKKTKGSRKEKKPKKVKKACPSLALFSFMLKK